MLIIISSHISEKRILTKRNSSLVRIADYVAENQLYIVF